MMRAKAKGSALAVTVVMGFSAIFFTSYKNGLVYHTQGKEISCEHVDTYTEAKQYAHAIGGVGISRFGEDRGCSYHYIYAGDWIFKMQADSAISYHASGFNTESIGACLVRTDNENFNKRTLVTARLHLKELDAKHDFDYAVFHEDIAKNGKTDPHEFKPWLIAWGMRWDERSYPWKVETAALEPRYLTYGK